MTMSSPDSAGDDVPSPDRLPLPDRPDLSGPDTAAVFGRLFDEHAVPLHRYLARRVGATIADDLVSETFLAALRGRLGYDPARAGARAWLYGIASNLLRHHVRDEIRALRATARLASTHATSDAGHENRVADRLDARRRVALLAGALAQLPDDDREVLLLTSWAGLSAVEIAEALDIPAGTVRSRLHRIRRRLRANATTITDDRGILDV
jgi:RNA polymerase sigma-70 factor (ECF subfamily)